MNEKQKSMRGNISSLLAGEAELPNLFCEPDIHISQSEGVCVRGIDEIEEYTDENIVFQLRRGRVVFTGQDLQIACCENGMAVLHGILLDVSFAGGGAFRC